MRKVERGHLWVIFRVTDGTKHPPPPTPFPATKRKLGLLTINKLYSPHLGSMSENVIVPATIMCLCFGIQWRSFYRGGGGGGGGGIGALIFSFQNHIWDKIIRMPSRSFFLGKKSFTYERTMLIHDFHPKI